MNEDNNGVVDKVASKGVSKYLQVHGVPSPLADIGGKLVVEEAKRKSKITLYFIIGPLCLLVFLLLIVVVGGKRTSAMEGISNAGSGGCIRSTDAWANFLEDEKDAPTFYKKFNALLAENPSVDFNTASAILTYGDIPDVEDRYACNAEESVETVDPDTGEVKKDIKKEECLEANQGSNKNSTKLYNEAKKIVAGLSTVGQSDEEVRKWLEENYIADKLKDMGRQIPTDETQKKELFTRTIDDIFGLRDQYKAMVCKEDNNQVCTDSNSADSSTKRKIRITSYQYAVNREDYGVGALGSLEPYINAGMVYFDSDNLAFWKGGSVGRGKVYGEPGKDYLIFATAHKGLIGKYGYTANGLIHYFEYGETFTVSFTINGVEKVYNAIVLDACGACMDWSVTSTGKYRPKSEKDKQYCAETNNTKLDVLTGKAGVKSKSDTGYMMDGSITSNCVVSGTFEDWKQVDERWKNIIIGNNPRVPETVGQIGCLITSVSIQIMRSGTKVNVSNFNPGIAAKKFDFTNGPESYNAFKWESAKNVAPNFEYVGKVKLANESKKAQIDMVKKLLNQGYYIVANVKDGGHWVAVTGTTDATILMSDPGHFGAGTDLYAAYPSNQKQKRLVQIAYYKKTD